MIFNFLKTIIFVFAVSVFISCNTDSDLFQPKHGSISINFEQPQKGANVRVKENEIAEVTHMVITIKNTDGHETDYTLKKVEVFEFEGSYLCEKIVLPLGTYQITTLYLVDREDQVLFATPQKDVLLAQNVKNSLPISDISSSHGANSVKIEVLSTKGFTPEDFGLESLEVKFADMFYFFVGLVQKTETLDFLSGQITILNGENEYQQDIKANIQKVNLQAGNEDYTVKIESEGYLPFEETFSYDSLLSYVTNPLVIELERSPLSKCVGGTYVGDVILHNQDDVDNFGNNCYTKVEGSLRIGSFFPEDPMAITDLGPLESVVTITRNLEIRNNKALISLHGLHNLVSVGGYVAIDGNNVLESLSSLSNISTKGGGLSISNNGSLTDLNGLQGLDHLSSNTTISNNKNLTSLSGLENIGWTNYLSIDNNESLTSFQGLVKITNIGHLNIANNNSLVSLTGLENSIKALNHLSITNNPKLKDLTALLSKEGTIVHDLKINGNHSLTSLKGLRFNKDITFNVKIENNPRLVDISAMSGINTIGRDLVISNNEKLPDLVGLENLFSVGNLYRSEHDYILSIVGNNSLKDFCALSYLFKEGILYKTNITLNAFNPTATQMKESNCSL